MQCELAGAILVGGRSRRMGRDKALLEVEGVALAHRAALAISSLCGEVAAVVGRERRYQDLRLHQVEDLRSDCGPLAGLEAAIDWAKPRPVVVLACDLPRVDRPVIERLLEVMDPAPVLSRPWAWVACRGGRLQPLCAVYSPACGSVFRRLLDAGERSVLAAVEGIDCRPVPFDDLEPDPFLNVNTPADLAEVVGP